MSAGFWLALAGVCAFVAGGRRSGRVEVLVAAGRLASNRRGAGGRTGGGAGRSARRSGVRAGPRRWLGRAGFGRGRRAARAAAELRLALGALTAELAAGGRPPAALEAAASAAPAHAAILTRASAAAGLDVAGVLRGEPATAPLGCAWQLAELAGAPLAGVVDRVAADLDSVAEQRRAVTVAIAGPRASAAVLAGLPVLGLLLGGAMGAAPLRFLLGTPAGVAVAAVGVALDAAGLYWMRRILRWATR